MRTFHYILYQYLLLKKGDFLDLLGHNLKPA